MTTADTRIYRGMPGVTTWMRMGAAPGKLTDTWFQRIRFAS